MLRRLVPALLLIFCLMGGAAQAQERGMMVIRDTEIEDTVRQWAVPIWRAAGLNPDAVDLILVQSPDFNAFVAGGSNIFLYTGMMEATKNPGELLGVIAHETGHIAGGHLIRGREAMEHASYEAMLAMLLGIGAGIGGGDSGAGNAVLMGGQGMALSGMLAHSRVQESSADQAGLRFLNAAHYSPAGMVSLLRTLQGQELVPASQQISYLQTHPLTADRLSAMETGADKSPYIDAGYPAAWNEEYARIRAKLLAFTEPQRVAWTYADSDTSVPAQYARAVAAYRRSEKDTAIKGITQLIALEPKNPYFHELKGQMLRDFGQLPEAVAEYRKAVALKPDAGLIRIDLAQVLVEMAGRGQPALYREAEQQLDLARAQEPRSNDAQRLYATIYGREGDEPRARYHLAEQAVLENRVDEAQKLLTGAMPGLRPGSRDFRGAQDLKMYLDSRPKKDEKKRR